MTDTAGEIRHENGLLDAALDAIAAADVDVVMHAHRSDRDFERNADLVGEPVWLRQIESPRPVGELGAGAPGGALPAGEHQPMLTSHPNRRRQQVEQAVQREPERVVQALRAWMAEDEVGS